MGQDMGGEVRALLEMGGGGVGPGWETPVSCTPSIAEILGGIEGAHESLCS